MVNVTSEPKKSNTSKIGDDMMLQAQGMTAASLAGMSATTESQRTNQAIEEAIRRVDEQYFDADVERPKDESHR